MHSSESKILTLRKSSKPSRGIRGRGDDADAASGDVLL